MAPLNFDGLTAPKPIASSPGRVRQNSDFEQAIVGSGPKVEIGRPSVSSNAARKEVIASADFVPKPVKRSGTVASMMNSKPALAHPGMSTAVEHQRGGDVAGKYCDILQRDKAYMLRLASGTLYGGFLGMCSANLPAVPQNVSDVFTYAATGVGAVAGSAMVVYTQDRPQVKATIKSAEDYFSRHGLNDLQDIIKFLHENDPRLKSNMFNPFSENIKHAPEVMEATYIFIQSLNNDKKADIRNDESGYLYSEIQNRTQLEDKAPIEVSCDAVVMVKNAAFELNKTRCSSTKITLNLDDLGSFEGHVKKDKKLQELCGRGPEMFV